MGRNPFFLDLLTRHEPADCSTSPGSDLARASSEPALSPAGRRRGCARRAVRLTGCRVSASRAFWSIRPPKCHDVADGRSHHRAVAEVPPLLGERVGVREDRDGGSRSSVAATYSRFRGRKPPRQRNREDWSRLGTRRSLRRSFRRCRGGRELPQSPAS